MAPGQLADTADRSNSFDDHCPTKRTYTTELRISSTKNNKRISRVTLGDNGEYTLKWESDDENLGEQRPGPSGTRKTGRRVIFAPDAAHVVINWHGRAREVLESQEN